MIIPAKVYFITNLFAHYFQKGIYSINIIQLFKRFLQTFMSERFFHLIVMTEILFTQNTYNMKCYLKFR